MNHYIEVSGSETHLINLINWLIEEVLSAFGGGDGIWYSKYYSIKDIEKLIIEHEVDLRGLKLDSHEKHLLLNRRQESLLITNNLLHWKARPSWQQVSIYY